MFQSNAATAHQQPSRVTHEHVPAWLHWIEVWTLASPQVWCNEMWVSCYSCSTVARTCCFSTLMCWTRSSATAEGTVWRAMLVNSYYVSWAMGVTKVSNS